jgi:hypothetical protein
MTNLRNLRISLAILAFVAIAISLWVAAMHYRPSLHPASRFRLDALLVTFKSGDNNTALQNVLRLTGGTLYMYDERSHTAQITFAPTKTSQEIADLILRIEKLPGIEAASPEVVLEY